MSSTTPAWTVPIPATPTTPRTTTGILSARGECRHPDHKGGVVLGVLRPDESPWDRLAVLLARIPNPWPRDGWILQMELQCPHCGEVRLVEQQQTYKGQRILCAVCGKDAPLVPAAGPRG